MHSTGNRRFRPSLIAVIPLQDPAKLPAKLLSSCGDPLSLIHV